MCSVCFSEDRSLGGIPLREFPPAVARMGNSSSLMEEFFVSALPFTVLTYLEELTYKHGFVRYKFVSCPRCSLMALSWSLVWKPLAD